MNWYSQNEGSLLPQLKNVCNKPVGGHVNISASCGKTILHVSLPRLQDLTELFHLHAFNDTPSSKAPPSKVVSANQMEAKDNAQDDWQAESVSDWLKRAGRSPNSCFAVYRTRGYQSLSLKNTVQWNLSVNTDILCVVLKQSLPTHLHVIKSVNTERVEVELLLSRAQRERQCACHLA